MKITTPEQKLIEAAKLDGWTVSTGFGGVGSLHAPCCQCFDGEPCRVKRYNTSYDAIIPLIQKQSTETKLKLCKLLYSKLGKTVRLSLSFNNAAQIAWHTTPSQLLDALLLAHEFEL